MPQPHIHVSRPDSAATPSATAPSAGSTTSSAESLGQRRGSPATNNAVEQARHGAADIHEPGASSNVGHPTAGLSLDAVEGEGIPDNTRLKIGELARRTGKTVRALHLYEELGLLRPARSEGGFRLYGPDELARVYWIGKLQDMGFKLQQIQGLLAAISREERAPAAMERVRNLFQGRIEQTRKQLRKLLQLERDLAEAIAYLDDCRTCPEVGQAQDACAECGQSTTRTAPELVSGIYLKTTDARVVQSGARPDARPEARSDAASLSFDARPRGVAASMGDGDLSSMRDMEEDEA